MAFVYTKPDQKNPAKKRWMARIKIAGQDEVISLRLVVLNNKRAAKERADKLQAEILLGTLSEESRAWLGDKSAARLMELMGSGSIRSKSASPTTWREAAEAYLAAKLPKDTKGDIPFKSGKQHRELTPSGPF